MRNPVTPDRIHKLLAELGARARGPGRIYLVGGSTALLLGFRAQTIDVDLKLDPEPLGIFEAISDLKRELDLNIELAAPDDFIPALPGWQERSSFLLKAGPVEFYHYDFYAQALAKIERGHSQDLEDVASLVRSGRVVLEELWRLFEAIKAALIRYPGIEPSQFERKVKLVLADLGAGDVDD